LSAAAYLLFNLHQDEKMESVEELSELITRQAELEKAMRTPGGARVIEEQELLAVRQKLAKLPPKEKA
jgi:hypothetical protein